MTAINPWIRKNIRSSHLLFLLMVITGVYYPEQMTGYLGEVTQFFAVYFDWLIVLSCTVFLIFCLILAFGRYGEIRLGTQDERPQFTTPSWLAMLFAAGMGTGLVFYGAAEPLFHMNSPAPTADGNMATISDALAAKRAMVVTMVHWGLHAWAIYTVCALTIAYFTFRQQQPMLASSPLSCLFTSEKLKPLWHLVNLFAVLAVVFGLVASLGQGVMQMDKGIREVGINIGTQNLSYLVILGTLTLCYIASALSGLGRGIKILSDLNMLTCVVLMLFILFLGPTHFIMETFTTSLGDYISRFISVGLNLRHFSGNEAWAQNWTITYFLWWIAWGPFVGVFIARISRGRTIKEFITGVLLVPTIFSFMWFATLGGTAIYMDMFNDAGLAQIANDDLAAATFALLGHLPISGITTVVTLFLVFVFLVTSADSGSYVLGMFTSDGNPTPPTFQKLFWGIMVAIVTGGLLLSGKGIMFIRAVAMAGAVPYLFIIMFQCYALWQFLKRDIQNLQQNFVNIAEQKSDTR